MFERFTDRARRVVVLAQEEARGLNHNYIGTEHILLGLLEPGGIAAQALSRFGMTAAGTRDEVDARVGRGSEPPKGKIPFTPRAKKVLELSLREALQLHHNYIGTEHILLGLVREGEGVAAQILTEHAGDLIAVRQAVLDLVKPGGAQALARAAAGCAAATCLSSRRAGARPANQVSRASRPGCRPRPRPTPGWPKRPGWPGASPSGPTICCWRRWPIRTARPPGPWPRWAWTWIRPARRSATPRSPAPATSSSRNGAGVT